MNISQLKELVRQVVKEEHDYQQLFKHMLDNRVLLLLLV